MRIEKAINEFLQHCEYRGLSPASIDWYRVPLERFARRYRKLPTSPGPIEAFLAETTGSDETKHARYRALKTFYSFIDGRHRIPNPMAGMKSPGRLKRNKKVIPTLEPQETMLLLGSTTGLRDRVLLSLLIDTGVRASEAAGLQKYDIRTETILVRGKTGEREVPISEETRQGLLALIATDGGSQYVFQGHKGPLTRHGVYRIVSAHMAKAGIHSPKLGPHRIRHNFGKSYLVNGGDLRSLQEIMGHADIRTTQIYVTLNLKNVTEKHHQFTPLRSAHAAAQQSLWNEKKAKVVEEAERILSEKEGTNRNSD